MTDEAFWPANSPISDIVFNATTQLWACCSAFDNGGPNCADPSNLAFSAQPLWPFYVNAHAIDTSNATITQASQTSAAIGISSSAAVNATHQCQLSTGAQAGIAVGFIVVGLVALAFIFWIGVLSRRVRQLRNENERFAAERSRFLSDKPGNGNSTEPKPVYEMPETFPASELEP